MNKFAPGSRRRVLFSPSMFKLENKFRVARRSSIIDKQNHPKSLNSEKTHHGAAHRHDDVHTLSESIATSPQWCLKKTHRRQWFVAQFMTAVLHDVEAQKCIRGRVRDCSLFSTEFYPERRRGTVDFAFHKLRLVAGAEKMVAGGPPRRWCSCECGTDEHATLPFLLTEVAPA